MCNDCCGQIRWGKVFLAALFFVIISGIVRQVETYLTMSYYLDPAYFPVWSKLMMPSAGPPPPLFVITSVFFSFITGIVLAAFYETFNIFCKGNTWQKILCFTGTLISLAFVFFTLPAILLINLPPLLLMYWLISTAFIIFLSALVFSRVLK